MYWGSFANGLLLRLFVIFNSAPCLSWLLGAPQSTWINQASSRQHTCAALWNELGESTAEVFLQWLQCQFGEGGADHHDDGPLFRASKEDPVVMVVLPVLDCYGSHWSRPVLKYCFNLKNGIHLVLRPQHTSHISQEEDVINFRKLQETEVLHQDGLL